MANKTGTKPGRPLTAREAALDILTRVEQEKAYSNLLLHQILQKNKLDRLDAALATEIVYGTIQRLNTIDYYLNRFVAKGVDKLQPWVRSLLRLSFYQLYYLDRIPSHAVVNEAVNISKKKGHQGISGMVNAVLRNVIRKKDELRLPPHTGIVQAIALEYSHPEWMVSRWLKQFGEETTKRICEANNEAPRVSLRVNTMKHDREQMLRMLHEHDLQAEPSFVSASGIVISHAGNMALTPWYAQGDFSIQDESSMLVGDIVDPQPGMTVLDCCAAPGGKTAHMAEKMRDQGKIWANDIHEHKQKLIDTQAERLGLRCIETTVGDAAKLGNRFAERSFDRILLDAPCSGLGVIRRKPDVKWSKQQDDIGGIASLQYEIVSSVQKLLKPGGVLVYSTCTIGREENQDVVERFLRNHSDFELDPEIEQYVPSVSAGERKDPPGMVQILPHHFHSDGFFIARLIRKHPV